MVEAENYVLTNECAPTYIIMRVSAYPHTILLYVAHASTQARTSRGSTWRHKKPSTTRKASYMAAMCASIFRTPCLGERLSLHADVERERERERERVRGREGGREGGRERERERFSLYIYTYVYISGQPSFRKINVLNVSTCI